jgi:UDP-glucose 4-epimerase
MARRTIVTGGAGFIGSHLVERLLKEGHEVIVLDNFSTGRPENLADFSDNPRLQVKQVDIAGQRTIQPFFKGVDWVFHLAALADIVPSIQQPVAYHKANVEGTVAVLEAARSAGVGRFIYVASSTCYGIPDEFPTPETAAPGPMYPYALTKHVAEQYVMHWYKLYKLPCLSLRFFNVYGPRSRTSGTYGAVFGVFLAQKLAGKPFTVVGDGKQTRDFTFVTDAVSSLITAAESSLTGRAFNAGSGNTYSVNRLVELLGNEAGVVYVPKRPGEPDCTQADISRIKAELGWSPRVSLEEGVQILLENIDYWRAAKVWDEKSIADATRDWFKYLGKSAANESE